MPEHNYERTPNISCFDEEPFISNNPNQRAFGNVMYWIYKNPTKWSKLLLNSHINEQNKKYYKKGMTARATYKEYIKKVRITAENEYKSKNKYENSDDAERMKKHVAYAIANGLHEFLLQCIPDDKSLPYDTLFEQVALLALEKMSKPKKK